jgi:23S rRNA (adenine2503-C2)-methyltransferase
MDMELAKSVLAEAKVPAFRLKQLRQAVFGQLADGWDAVTTFSADLRAQLTPKLPWSVLTPVREAASSDSNTVKAALRTADGLVIEAVLMRHGDGRRTVCVSSQAGCPMKCVFCATGKLGLKRNLTVAEITEQVLYFARQLKPRGEAVTNVVVMGMGEPMHNLDAVLAFIRELNAPDGLNLGARRISISTCGIVPGILRLADEPLQVNLAISLHAATQELRERLMPVARAYPLDKLMNAVNQYINKADRQVMFEYLLIDGVNDRDEDAEALAKLMRHRLYHVNLIKYHSTGEYHASPRDRRDRFMQILEEHGVSVSFRLSFGEDIDAACGQLAGQTA